MHERTHQCAVFIVVLKVVDERAHVRYPSLVFEVKSESCLQFFPGLVREPFLGLVENCPYLRGVDYTDDCHKI